MGRADQDGEAGEVEARRRVMASPPPVPPKCPLPDAAATPGTLLGT